VLFKGSKESFVFLLKAFIGGALGRSIKGFLVFSERAANML